MQGRIPVKNGKQEFLPLLALPFPFQQAVIGYCWVGREQGIASLTGNIENKDHTTQHTVAASCTYTATIFLNIIPSGIVSP